MVYVSVGWSSHAGSGGGMTNCGVARCQAGATDRGRSMQLRTARGGLVADKMGQVHRAKFLPILSFLPFKCISFLICYLRLFIIIDTI